jgi:hypothetical protein
MMGHYATAGSRSPESLSATRVVIAHRRSRVEKADCIYVLEKGQLVEKGGYAGLMAFNGTFAALSKCDVNDMRKALFFSASSRMGTSNGSSATGPGSAELIRQGMPTDSLFFVLDGEFEVFTAKAPQLAILEAGEVMGEISFVDSPPPTASVKALMESQGWGRASSAGGREAKGRSGFQFPSLSREGYAATETRCSRYACEFPPG